VHHLSLWALISARGAVYNLPMTRLPDLAVRRMSPWSRALLSIYLAGLVVWLVLGVIHQLADVIPPMHRAISRISEDGGLLAVYASRIVDGTMPPEPVGDVVLAYFFSGLNLALGVLLIVKGPPGLVPQLLALAFIGTAATFNEPSHAVFHVLGEPALIRIIHFAFHVASGVAYLWSVVLFPDGRPPTGRSWGSTTRRLIAAALTVGAVVVCWQSSFIAHPPFFVAFFGVLVPIAGMIAQTVRLRSEHDPAIREQSRLLRVALLPALTAAAVWLAAETATLLGLVGDAGHELAAIVQAWFPAVFAVVPVMLFIAIIRNRLWNIDVIASRVLLMALLAVAIGVVYVGSLGLTGWLLRRSGWFLLVPLVVVACVVEPVREWCQRIGNRLVFGARLSPREAVQALVDRFAGAGDVDELTELTRVVVDSTRATRATMWLIAGDRLLQLASHPTSTRDDPWLPLAEPSFPVAQAALVPARCWPITYEGALLGIVAIHTPHGVALTPVEERLLNDLSHHAGLLVANARLTIDLGRELETVARRAAALEVSRQQVVLAQDRQRRQLEADIHDGAQQLLVALLVQLGVLQRAGSAGSPPADRVEPLRSLLAETRKTLAQLAAGGGPPELLDSGLAVALDRAAEAARQAGLSVEVECDDSGLVGADVRAAVYYCCVEALQNAVKHARATSASVRIRSDVEAVTFTVSDNGAGFSLDQVLRGSGLGNLNRRLAAHGGEVEVESSPGRGTTVHGSVPTLSDGVLAAAGEAATP
jgi:signal transduction histidine kinase